MNKAEFLNELSFCLQHMNDSEKNKFIIYYDEMISDYVENGMTEEEAVDKIGSPKKIAEELLDDSGSVKISLPSTGIKGLNVLLTVLGFPLWGSLLLAFILMVFSLYIIIWCAPFATGALSIGFFTTSIIGIAGSPFVMIKSVSIGIMQLGIGIASVGISLLLGFATIDLSKKLIILTKNLNAKLAALFKKKVVIG
ncbi:DUF1700 domain-containing protein [Anaerocolumna sp.]|uniref:DUF1700 domain-containing protein n=1 Tax=Anaerocolumna sp. TaxID=2041569 RepID=UPI0028B260FA|nr:DUF1700 domain-containing protein [Anaerocolumna sp.]